MSQSSDPKPTRRSIAAAVTLVQKRLAAERHARVQGLRGSSRAAYLAALYRAAPRPLLVLAADAGAAETLAADLLFFLGEEPALSVLRKCVHVMPAWDVSPFAPVSPEPGDGRASHRGPAPPEPGTEPDRRDHAGGDPAAGDGAGDPGAGQQLRRAGRHPRPDRARGAARRLGLPAPSAGRGPRRVRGARRPGRRLRDRPRRPGAARDGRRRGRVDPHLRPALAAPSGGAGGRARPARGRVPGQRGRGERRATPGRGPRARARDAARGPGAAAASGRRGRAAARHRDAGAVSGRDGAAHRVPAGRHAGRVRRRGRWSSARRRRRGTASCSTRRWRSRSAASTRPPRRCS